MNYVAILKEELKQRKKINSSYSLRSFARDLSISASNLSEILNNKHGISVKNAYKVIGKLGLEGNDKEFFLQSIRRKKLSNIGSKLSINNFNLISDWEYLAISEYSQLTNSVCTIETVANAFDISINRSEHCLEKLLELEILKKKGVEYFHTGKAFVVSSELPSLAIRNYHKQILQKAQKALDTKLNKEREFSSNVVSIKKDSLPEAKEFLIEMRREFEKKFSNTSGDSIYNLSIQYFELTD